jgi:hypothetical protein
MEHLTEKQHTKLRETESEFKSLCEDLAVLRHQRDLLLARRPRLRGRWQYQLRKHGLNEPNWYKQMKLKGVR